MGFAPTWLRQVSPPPLLHKTTLTTVCYHAEFGRSALKSAGINTVPLNTWELPKLVSAGTLLSCGGRSD